MGRLPRRAFLQSAMLPALAGAVSAPIVDCHIHLFDQTRPQGAPYSGGGKNTEPALPARYRKLVRPLGIVGAIAVEASPWVEDNLWLLEVEQRDPMMLGAIGNLQPDKPEFAEYLDRYRKNPLFLGIRYGNLWGYDLVKQAANPAFLDGLKRLQEADLTLDTANPRPDLIEAVKRVSDRVPGLRIVLDHLPSMSLDAATERNLRELAVRPSIYVKISQVMRLVNDKAVTNPAFYKPLIDPLYDIFGPGKLIFGSDWPNAAAVDHLPTIVRIARDYFDRKGPDVAERYFHRNSQLAYKWKSRA